MENEALLQKDISELLGLNGVSQAERDDMLANIGGLILESTMMRIIGGLSDEEAGKFEEFVAQDPSPDAMLNELRRIEPTIDEIVKEETIAFKVECIKVMERQGTLQTA